MAAIAQDPAPQTAAPYLIGPGDEITVKVLGEPQFDFVARIDEDGKLEVPYVDKTAIAKCRTERDLRADVTKLFSKYLKNPQLSLRVTERRSVPPATIYGEVRQPQQVVLNRKARLIELISFSGGVTEDAGGLIQVFRTQTPMCSASEAADSWSAEGVGVPFKLYSLSNVQQGKEEANPLIYPGDVIVVQKASPVYINGEVRAPGGLRIKEGGLSLTQAVAMVGGPSQAKLKMVNIYRLKDNSQDRELIAVNYEMIKMGKQKDVMLQPYDIIEVDKPAKKPWEVVKDLFIGGAKTLIQSTLPTRVLY